MSRCLRVACGHLWQVTVIFGLLATPKSGLCDVFLASEALSLELTNNLGLLGYNFGADPNSPLTFTTFVNPTGSAFSYTSISTSYNGQNFALTGSGTIDAGGNLAVSASGFLGAESLASAGDGTAMLALDGSFLVSIHMQYKNPKHGNDRNAKESGTRDASTNTGYYTTLRLVMGKPVEEKIPDSDFKSTDFYDKDGKYHESETPITNFSTPVPQLDMAGLLPRDGGGGSLTATIAPVPEPGSFLLLAGMGSLGVATSWWRRKLAGIRALRSGL
jgi:hypothetical protein